MRTVCENGREKEDEIRIERRRDIDRVRRERDVSCWVQDLTESLAIFLFFFLDLFRLLSEHFLQASTPTATVTVWRKGRRWRLRGGHYKSYCCCCRSCCCFCYCCCCCQRASSLIIFICTPPHLLAFSVWNAPCQLRAVAKGRGGGTLAVWGVGGCATLVNENSSKFVTCLTSSRTTQLPHTPHSTSLRPPPINHLNYTVGGK